MGLLTRTDATIDFAHKHVVSSDDGDLPLWLRIRLWIAMGQDYGDESTLRRSCLALYSFQQLLSRWDLAVLSAKYRHIPNLCRDAGQQYLRGVLSQNSIRSIIRDIGESFEDYESECSWANHGDVNLAYQGGFYLLNRVVDRDDEWYLKDNLFDEAASDSETLRPADFGLGDARKWDIHFVTSIVTANGAVWDEQSNNDKRRAFWLDWLARIVPRFTGDLASALDAAGL